MADGNNSVKFKDTVPYLVKIIIAVCTAFFGWLKLADRYIYIFGTVFSCYTFAVVSASVIILVYLVSYIKKNNGNFNFNSGFFTAVLCVLLVCAVNCTAEDVKNSKVKDVIPIGTVTAEDDNAPSVVLCEVTAFNSTMNDFSTFINVYHVKDRIARKIGVIDEVYFSVECIKDGLYDYFINYEKNTVTIECSYGYFGDGIIEINPAYETGKIQYVFKLD